MKKLLINFIKVYQKYISANRPPTCKYYPTCSAYSIEAIQTHGAFKGLFLSTWRIIKCNPLSKGGYDPVPSNKKINKVKNGK